jgi:hypothetical protein
MSNHYHLVLYATSDELSNCMKRLNMLYSTYHNKKYSLSGHAFDGPYRAYRQDPSVLFRCIAYVLMNPVKAYLVDEPQDYAWSCCKQFLGLPGSPMEADLNGLMGAWKGDLKLAWRWFHRAMEVEARRQKPRFADGLTMNALHAQQFEWFLEIARERQDQLGAVPPELAAIFWARQTGITVKAIAKVLGISSRAVSDALYQLKGRLKKDPALGSTLTRP